MNVETIHAYFAGFFDGEGCVNFINVGRAATPQVNIGNTVREPLDMAKELFGGNIYFRSNEKYPQWQPSYLWNLGSRSDIKRFLLAILPYTCIKRPQIKLVLEYFDVCRVSRCGRDYLSDEEKLLRDDYAKALRLLNSGTNEQKELILKAVS